MSDATCVDCQRPLFDGEGRYCDACREYRREQRIARNRERSGWHNDDDSPAARMQRDWSRGYA